MDNIQKLRMKRLIKLLENFNEERKKTTIPQNGPIKKFNMAHWGCGTAACALGSAACHPYFQKHGLMATKEDQDDEYFSVVLRRKGKADTEGLDAAKRFFGITYAEAVFLFTPHDIDADGWDKIKPKFVAKRVREVLAKYA